MPCAVMPSNKPIQRKPREPGAWEKPRTRLTYGVGELTTDLRSDVIGGGDKRLPLLWGERPRVDEGVDLIDEGIELVAGCAHLPGVELGDDAVEFGDQARSLLTV